jgi:trehalose 6-phosphate phosphatase
VTFPDDQSVTPAGRAGLAKLLDQPQGALIGLDFDGTLAPIVPDPGAARAHPGVVPARIHRHASRDHRPPAR